MYVISTEKAAGIFEGRLQTAARNAKLFATDTQETDFLRAARDAYVRVARGNVIKVVVLPEQFFNVPHLLKQISSSSNLAACKKLLADPTLLFTTQNIDVPADSSPAPLPRHKENGRRRRANLTIDNVREAVLYYLEKHNTPPTMYSGLIEEGNPLHDGKRTWSSLNSAIRAESLGLKNTGFKSLLNFCRIDLGLTEKRKSGLTVDNVREAILHHIKRHAGMTPKVHAGVIEEGNPLHDGKRTWVSINQAIRDQKSGFKNTGFKSILDFCKKDEEIQNLYTSYRHQFNYSALIQTIVAHTNATKEQPDELDTTPIQHGPLADGFLTWSNVACALKRNDKRLCTAEGLAPTNLNTLFEQAVLTRPDVVKHFALPLPSEMQEERKTKSSAPVDDFTVVVVFR